MNRINLSLVAFFLLSMFAANGQDEPERSKDVTITKSTAYPVVDARYKMYYPLQDNRVLGVKIGGKKSDQFTFQVFSGPELNQERFVTEQIKDAGFDFQFISELGEKIYMFYSIRDASSKTTELFARKINTEKGGFDGTGESLIMMSDEISTSAGFRQYYYHSFKIDISSDGKLFVIKYSKSPENKDDSKNNDIIGLHVFRSDLSKVTGGEYEMPYTEALMDNLDFTVDSKGTGYFLIRKYREEANRKNTKDPDNQSLAVLITNDSDDMKEVEFSLGDKLPTSFMLSENTQGNIVCAGYYQKPGNYGVDGAYVTIMEKKNNDFTEPNFYEFSKEFIMMYHKLSEHKKRKVEKKDAEDKLSMNGLEMRNIQMLDDGGLVLVGEIFYITATTDSKGNTRTTYHFDDVITIKINKDGELGWMKKFPKRSTSESFKLMTSKEYSYIIFTDNPKNARITTEQNPGKCSAKDLFVIAYRTNNLTGESDYLPLFGYRQIDGINVYQYSLRRIINLTDNKFAVEMYIKGKKDMMFQVEFKEQ